MVVEDRHLVMREDHRQEIAVPPAPLPSRACATPRGRRRAVVAVGDVERRQGFDGAREAAIGRGLANDPELVAHAVVGGHVDLGRAAAARAPACASISGAAG